jgi:hypothetical protein
MSSAQFDADSIEYSLEFAEHKQRVKIYLGNTLLYITPGTMADAKAVAQAHYNAVISYGQL